MFAAIRHAVVTSLDTVIRHIQEDFVPNTLVKLPGYAGFYLIQVSADEFYTVSLFATKEQAEESNRLALDWARQTIISYIVGKPDFHVGEVTFSELIKPKGLPGQMAA